MIVYVSGALKGSRDLVVARALYEEAAQIVADAGHQAYLPHQHTDPEYAATVSALEVFRRDVAALKSADCVVAFLGDPSLGVGAELAICAQEGIPLLGLYKRADDLSRFAVGMLEAVGARLACYAEGPELATAIHSFLEEVMATKAPRDTSQSAPHVPRPHL